MALALCSAFVLVLCATLAPFASAGDRDCQSYRDLTNIYQSSQRCYSEFCCGSCYMRYCCKNTFLRLTEDKQDECDSSGFISASPLPMIIGIVGCIVAFLIFICCCVCPCCCLYKMCRKPRPVIATTHTTVVTTTPQHYPQQPTAVPGHPQTYQGAQYPPYQPIPVQPGYRAQHMPTSTYPGQPLVPGPPPTYQEATSPAYPPQPMPYSQAAYTPGQPSYPLQPPSKPNAPVSQVDYLTQPAYNPDYFTPPPTTG